MKRRKKGVTLPLEVLLRIVIGIVILIFVYKFASGLVKLGLASKETYNVLLDRMDRLNGQNLGSTSVSLNLNKGTALLIFPRNVTQVVAGKQLESTPSSYGTVLNYHRFLFRRPTSQCKLKDDCICLCKSLEESDWENKRFLVEQELPEGIFEVLATNYFYDCKSMMCKPMYEKLQFKSSDWFHVRDDETPAFIRLQDEKSGTLKIQKYKHVFGFCMEFPCLSDEDTGSIDYGKHWEAVKTIRKEMKKMDLACNTSKETLQEKYAETMIIPEGYIISYGSNPKWESRDKSFQEVIPYRYCDKPPQDDYIEGIWMPQIKGSPEGCCIV